MVAQYANCVFGMSQEAIGASENSMFDLRKGPKHGWDLMAKDAEWKCTTAVDSGCTACLLRSMGKGTKRTGVCFGLGSREPWGVVQPYQDPYDRRPLFSSRHH